MDISIEHPIDPTPPIVEPITQTQTTTQISDETATLTTTISTIEEETPVIQRSATAPAATNNTEVETKETETPQIETTTTTTNPVEERSKSPIFQVHSGPPPAKRNVAMKNTSAAGFSRPTRVYNDVSHLL